MLGVTRGSVFVNNEGERLWSWLQRMHKICVQQLCRYSMHAFATLKSLQVLVRHQSKRCVILHI